VLCAAPRPNQRRVLTGMYMCMYVRVGLVLVQPNSATDPELLDAIAWRQDQLAQLRGDAGGGGGGGDGAFDGADGVYPVS